MRGGRTQGDALGRGRGEVFEQKREVLDAHREPGDGLSSSTAGLCGPEI